MTSSGRTEGLLGAVSWSPSLFPSPTVSSLRRAQLWQPHYLTFPCLDRVAYHEAGHVVYLEWLGWPCASAKAEPERGMVQLRPLPDDLPPDSGDPDGTLTASAAGLYHAGTCAELLHAGVPWVGPIHRPEQADHKLAEAMLSTTFGCNHSGAHAYAQRMALHVLANRWGRVCEVAAAMIASGTWQPE